MNRLVYVVTLAFFGCFLGLGKVASQVNSDYRAVVIQYAGPSDRPFLPVILGATKEDAEAFRSKLLNGAEYEFADIYIRPQSTLKAISNTVRQHKSLDATDKTRRGVLIITICRGEGVDKRSFTAEESELVLKAIGIGNQHDQELTSTVADLRNRIVGK
jgi:hypothetical protein